MIIGEKIKKVAGVGITVTIIWMVVNSVFFQYQALMEAKKQVESWRQEEDKLVNENEVLKQKLEYATSSAFLAQFAREKVGVGQKNDYWIKGIELGPFEPEKKVTIEKKSILSRWIDWFTQHLRLW